MSTVLDPSSAQELLKMAPQQDSVLEHELLPQMSSRQYWTDTQEYCETHPDEVLSYFCFNCEGKCICAECVIHGKHKSHEVMRIKKAYPVVRSELEDLLLQLSNKVDEVEMAEERLESRKKEIFEQTQTCKQQIQHSFEDLRARLDKRERELLLEADKVQEENLQEIESCSRALISKAGVLRSMLDKSTKVVKGSEPVELLNFYAEQKVSLEAQATADHNLAYSIEKIIGMKCYIDPQDTANHIDSIKGLQTTVKSLGGVEKQKPKLKKK